MCNLAEEGGGDIQVLEGHTGEASACAWSRDGTRLASASLDTTVGVWSVAEEGGEPRVLEGHSGDVYCCVWIPDGACGAPTAPVLPPARHGTKQCACRASPEGAVPSACLRDILLW